MIAIRTEFIEALRANQEQFGIELNDAVVERLADFYEIVQEHNPILHLVGQCSPAEFATRHVLESLTLLKHLPSGVRFADVGSGGGLPAIPCLLVRDDLKAVLIESKEKKTTFLQTAVERLGISSRADIVTRQYAEFTLPNVYAVTCRALDKFTTRLPRLLKWTGNRVLLFFGGPALRDELEKLGCTTDSRLMPLSEQRYLFVTRRRD